MSLWGWSFNLCFITRASALIKVFIVEVVTDVSYFCLAFLKLQMPVQYLSTLLASQLLYRRAQVDTAEPGKYHALTRMRNGPCVYSSSALPPILASCHKLISTSGLSQYGKPQTSDTVFNEDTAKSWRRPRADAHFQWLYRNTAKFISQGQTMILSLILLWFLLHLESNARDSVRKAFCLNSLMLWKCHSPFN